MEIKRDVYLEQLKIRKDNGMKLEYILYPLQNFMQLTMGIMMMLGMNT